MNEQSQDFIEYQRPRVSPDDMIQRSKDLYDQMDQRRTVREFSSEPIPRKVIEQVIMAASTAPSGAHKQPWTFCAISDPNVKATIREAAEKEEYINYHGRMSEEWLDDLKAFGTDWNKPFLEIAPWLIVVFRKIYEIDESGKKNNYYVNESVGIATGMLLTAIHLSGLVALTHTPSPMKFLGKILERPDNERPFLLIPVGYPSQGVKVPNINRKPLNEVAVFFD